MTEACKIIPVVVRHNGLTGDAAGRRISISHRDIRRHFPDATYVQGVLEHVGRKESIPVTLKPNQNYFYAGHNTPLPEEWDYTVDDPTHVYVLHCLVVR